jgi:hypothetical protein
MDKNTKGIIAVAATLAVVGGVYYFFFRKKDVKTDSNLNANTRAVKENLGAASAMYKDGTVQADFGGKYTVQFFTNNRFTINEKGVSGFIKKGSFVDGGKKLILDDGKTVEGGSVWTNLQNTLV